MKNSRKLINESIIIGSLWFYLYEEFWFCNVNNYNVLFFCCERYYWEEVFIVFEILIFYVCVVLEVCIYYSDNRIKGLCSIYKKW